MNNYVLTIGLEIHAELKTRTKMFCDCLNDPLEKHPNANVCVVCLAHPGSLPVINKAAVEAVLKVGMALNGDIPQFSKFDRKNYFYPDLPKGYQISQYDLPLVFGGMLRGVRLRRVHLEEDTARLAHESSPDSASGVHHSSSDAKSERPTSLVDFNRAGVPLMELVTEPDIKNADQAVEFAKELQLILRYLGVSDADMEKGQMRVEANVSIQQITNDKSQMTKTLGTKVEVKNINSFKAVYDAIEYELKRQEEVLEGGGKVHQETRGWDEKKGVTVSQRMKEEAHDYRYFPEPDLSQMDLSKFDWQALKLAIPELPPAKRSRFSKEYGFTPEQAEILITDRNMAEFFEEAASELKEELPDTKDYSLLYNYLVSDLRGFLIEKGIGLKESKISPENFADLMILVSSGKINSRVAKDLLAKMEETGLDPQEIVKSEGLEQVSGEGELFKIAEEVMKENLSAVEDYKKGKAQALQFLVGKTMARLKGRGNPTILQEIFKKLLL